jgi:hypothetical protein
MPSVTDCTAPLTVQVSQWDVINKEVFYFKIPRCYIRDPFIFTVLVISTNFKTKVFVYFIGTVQRVSLLFYVFL